MINCSIYRPRELGVGALAVDRRRRGGDTAHFRGGQAVAESLRATLAVALREGGIIAARLGEGVAGAPHPAFPDAPLPATSALLLLEATEPVGAMHAADACAARLRPRGSCCRIETWRLLQSLWREELSDATAARQRPREELRRAKSGWPGK